MFKKRLLSAAGLMLVAEMVCAQSAPPAGAPGMDAGGMGARQREVYALTTPGVTKCATEADFLAYKDLSCPQTGGFPLPKASAEQLEKNKELVIRFYQGDRSVIADNLIQHDPGEPSTRKAWEEFFSYRMKGNAASNTKKPELGGPMGYGVTPVDSTGSPVNYLIAEGDMVVALRFRWWEWPGGPEPIFKGVFADIWRVKDGKLAEQWCTCTPEDTSPAGTEMAKKDGKWIKFKNLHEQ
ncbi:MAG: hypothetical protein QM808_03135 [Steroidobacteraceae bacterium]